MSEEFDTLLSMANGNDEIKVLAPRIKTLAEEFYYNQSIALKAHLFKMEVNKVKGVLNNYIKKDELNLFEPETLTWQEIVLLNDFGRFNFAEELDNEGIKRIGFALEAQLSRPAKMWPGRGGQRKVYPAPCGG